ncbi:hypothetical protein P3L10_025530 [Capsicum annuum]
MILPRKERRIVAIFLDITLMELLDTESSQTTNDIIGPVNHIMLPISMRSADNSMQRLRNTLAKKQAKVEVAKAALEAAHEEEKGILQAQISSLNSLMEKES